MRKHILRAVLVEIIVTISAERIDLLLHWQGSEHVECRCQEKMNRLIRRGVVPVLQACIGAPWVISADALELPEFAQALKKEASPSA